MLSKSKKGVVARLSDSVFADCRRIVIASLMIESPMMNDHAASLQCRQIDISQSTRLSLNLKGYVQIKTCSPGSPNEKVQLHQLLIWEHPNLDHRAFVRHNIANTRLEASHLCHNKKCTNPWHLWLEPSEVNKSRRYCEVSIVVSKRRLMVCRHEPHCISRHAMLSNPLVFH
jgi:hypothetical protein